MKLWEINKNINDLIHQDIEDEAFYTTLELLEDEFNEKAINVAKYIKNIESDINQLKQFILDQQARKKALESQKERLTAYLINNVDRLIEQPISTPELNIKTRRSESVEIEDYCALPPQFTRITETRSADKAKIKQALKSGVVLDGVSLKTNYSVCIK